MYADLLVTFLLISTSEFQMMCLENGCVWWSYVLVVYSIPASRHEAALHFLSTSHVLKDLCFHIH